MRQSELFFKTIKEVPSDADSKNASYLIRAGFIDKNMSGVYALLPLGFRVYKKIENIIREEMDEIGGQEILMNVLQKKQLWDETGRFEEMKDIFYQIGDDMGLAPTHEEQVTDIIRTRARSYKDLPVALYQIQTKFRHELRAKSGLLRGREFIMKDLYSFHTDEQDFEAYYKKATEAYFKIYKRMGLDVKLTEASGGVFSKYSHEFQVEAEAGEDLIYCCDSGECDFCQNKEIAEVKHGDKCPKCGGAISEKKAIEVGNIFSLKNKFSKAMGALYIDKDGKAKDIMMGCYGIGLTRCMATVVEVYFDAAKNKMVWPREIAPYEVHLISLRKDEEASELYKELKDKGIEVLFDDREMSPGQKFAQADLIGCPKRIVVSDKSLNQGGFEYNDGQEVQIVDKTEILKKFK